MNITFKRGCTNLVYRAFVDGDEIGEIVQVVEGGVRKWKIEHIVDVNREKAVERLLTEVIPQEDNDFEVDQAQFAWLLEHFGLSEEEILGELKLK